MGSDRPCGCLPAIAKCSKIIRIFGRVSGEYISLIVFVLFRFGGDTVPVWYLIYRPEWRATGATCHPA